MSSIRINTLAGEKGFIYAGPKLSNQLPYSICHAVSLEIFKKHLKTHLWLIIVFDTLFMWIFVKRSDTRLALQERYINAYIIIIIIIIYHHNKILNVNASIVT